MTFSATSWIDQAPENWARGRLKGLVGIVMNGTWGEDPDGNGSDVNCVRAADFDRNRQRVSREKLPKRHVAGKILRQHLLMPGDLILEKSGGGEKQPVGAAVLFDLSEPSVCSNFCARIVPAAGIDSRFLTYVFATAYSQGLTQSAIKQTTGIQNLDSGAFFATPWARPPLKEQRRIADFLDAETARIDRSVSVNERALTLLDERRHAIIYHEVIGSRIPGVRARSGLGWVEELPAIWDVVPLKYVARLGSGHTPSRTHPEYWENCTIPWISLFDVGRMRNPRQEELSETTQLISELGMANSSACLHPTGTVVLSRTASVGFSTIMGHDMAVSQHFVTWTCGERLLPKYLLYLLRAMRQYFESVQVGTTNVTVFMPDLYAIEVPLPSVAQQREIIGRVGEQTAAVDRLADRLKRQAKLLAERRQALITAAVTGRIDVTTARGVEVG